MRLQEVKILLYLTAWDQCCQPRTHGGLGLKDLATQNLCLLLKLLHRIHSPGDSAWATWIRECIDIVTLQGDLDGSHWNSLHALLPTYRELTTVMIKNGKTTS